MNMYNRPVGIHNGRLLKHGARGMSCYGEEALEDDVVIRVRTKILISLGRMMKWAERM